MELNVNPRCPHFWYKPVSGTPAATYTTDTGRWLSRNNGMLKPHAAATRTTLHNTPSHLCLQDDPGLLLS
jgi:hypothetical protein